MKKINICQLENRALLKLSGDDSRAFLQGLISNDVKSVNEDNIIYSGMFNAQGKFFCDFFIFQPYENDPNTLYMDCNKYQFEEVIQKLNMYKLRSSVKIEDISEFFSIFFQIDVEDSENINKKLPDELEIHFREEPRCNELGKRIYLSKKSTENLNKFNYNIIDYAFYEKNRINLGIPEAITDIRVNKDFPLEFGINEMNGISFSKGCYIGQEITARTFNRGKLKKNIYIVKSSAELPEFDTKIYYQKNIAGRMLSKFKSLGLAVLDIKIAEYCIEKGIPLLANDTKLEARKPNWKN